MSSNMQAGERRWASARRGGMTVLGKVAVPKPLNLPSQRLENHGVDPSVEIVPKGTIGWGSRPSSSGSNAWVSSSQSPNADGRPSSGGSGTTRPSTAGSCDRTHEPVSSAWGPNSRPSSASGALASNNSSSTSLRPKSAETRPNSSQLSRFAETVSESSVAWGPNSAAERLGGKSSKGDGFSLSSGDFPTLGTEKQNTIENLESQQDCGRPSSASGRVTQLKEKANYHSESKSGVVTTWRPNASQSEDSFHLGAEKWTAEHQQYYNHPIPPQHFDAWRGPPINALPGGWYRGPPRGPAFGGPGGFPMEPYPPYYRHQAPPPGGPRGPHQKNGEFYQGPPGPPHMPESFARPGMPFRPSFYQGRPGMPGPRGFESYYGPPMGYHMNERDIPYMGLPAGPPVYNCYPGPGPGPDGPPDNAVSHARHKELNRKEEGENLQYNVQTRRNNEWGAYDDDGDAEREISVMMRKPSDNSSRNPPYRDGGMHNVTVNDDGWTNESGSQSNFPPQALQLSVSSERELPLLPPPNKDHVLMQKIEGLNAKIRASNGQNANFDANNNTARAHVPRELIGPGRDNQIRPTDIVSRTQHGGQGKGKFNNQDHDGQRKQITPGFSGAAKAVDMESASGVHVHASSFVGKAVEKHSVSSVAKSEGEIVAEAYDSTDIQAQRAKMRELAKQRALQLQKEEEERIKDQKAKALAKLEELNRRTKTGEAVIGQAEKVVGTREEEESCRPIDFTVVGRESVKSRSGKSDEVSENLQAADSLIGLSQNQPSSTSPGFESDIVAEVPVHMPADAPQTGIIQSNSSDGHTMPVKENSCGDDRKAVVPVNDVATSINRRTGYKQKQQKTFNEKSVPKFATEAHKNDTGVADVDITSMGAPQSIESNLCGTSNTATSTTTQRKKVNKSAKNKHKLEETQASSAQPVVSEKNVEKKSIPESKAVATSTVLQSEESESRSSNIGKQAVQRMPKGQQAKRFTDKAHGSEVVWAPVRTHNKSEDSVEAGEKITRESTDFIKSDNVAHNTFKGKRAEMERYIPKPVAKELAQQVNVQLPPEVPVMVQFGSVDFGSTQIVSSTNASFGSVSLDIKEGDRHNKYKKEHGHRRQGTTKHSLAHEPKHIELSQSETSDKSSANPEINASVSVDADMSSNTITVGAVSRSVSVKDHGATGRGKRRMPAPRRTRNNPDIENDNTAEMHGSSVQLAAPDVNYNDKTVNIREHLGLGERTSQWKPKSHTNSTDNQQSDKPVGSETVINKLPKKAQPSQRKVHVHDKEESSNIDNSFHDSTNPAEGSMQGHHHHHHQGFNREKKPIPTKGRPSFPNQDPVLSGESDVRRHGGRSNRYGRGGHEFYGDRPSGQDNRPHNFQRQRQYEYQPVGHTKGGNLEKHDELTDGGNYGGQRFQERGHNQSKHGGHNFARQGGAGRVESGQH